MHIMPISNSNINLKLNKSDSNNVDYYTDELELHDNKYSAGYKIGQNIRIEDASELYMQVFYSLLASKNMNDLQRSGKSVQPYLQGVTDGIKESGEKHYNK